ncbi:alpha/beta fold hydrolase [Micromonospora sp. NEAU-HG-1]|nr:alpha/beta fold hydrolase [Micromonospora rubida]
MEDEKEGTVGRRAGRKVVAAVAVAAGALAWLVAGSPAAEAARHAEPTVDWQPCPTYSDEVLRSRDVPDERIPEFRALLNRMDCGTVGVPLDYRQPQGRQITVAITRLRAAYQTRRLGSIAVNPGGPGAGGYLTPLDFMMTNQESARLGDRYDLIGFDPRGTGYSTKVRCTNAGPGGPPTSGPLTEAAARANYDAEVAGNAACGQSDPDILGQLTTVNVARDLERVRVALRERKLNFLGVSWGTWLGAVYRSNFPGSVGRMFLDSVASPEFSVDSFDDGRAAAVERRFSRLAAWIASRHDTYGFGTSAGQVRAAILELVRAYDTNPKQYTDLSRPADGAMVARLAGQDSRDWTRVSQALAELRGWTGTTAPPTVREIFSARPRMIPPGAPEVFNPTMQKATVCNEDPARFDFATAWAEYQQRLEQNPVTGRATVFSAGCAGWPLPGREVQLRPAAGSLVLAGHRYEAGSPYEWTPQMRAAVGGTMFTVDDDVHGSVLRVPDCAAEMVSYFATGRIDQGCDGVPVP